MFHAYYRTTGGQQLKAAGVGDMHRYKCWRANGNEDRGDPNGLIHVLCHEGEAFEMLPARIRRLGPWIGSREGEIANLKPHYRMLLVEQGFVVLYIRPTKLQPE